jgi:hypothetical protein
LSFLPETPELVQVMAEQIRAAVLLNPPSFLFNTRLKLPTVPCPYEVFNRHRILAMESKDRDLKWPLGTGLGMSIVYEHRTDGINREEAV